MSKPVNLKGFVHYAVSNPQYLREIGKYLLHRIEKHIRLGQRERTMVAVAALKAMIESSESDDFAKVAIYEDSIKAAVLTLLQQNDVDYKTLGVETFVKYAEKREEEEYRMGKLDVFYDSLVALCLYTSPRAQDETKVRQAGLHALYKMLLLNDIRNSAQHFSSIIPAILDNIDAVAPPGSPTASSRHGAAVLCWHEVAHSLDLTNVSNACHHVFLWLDERQWNPVQTAVFCLHTLTNYSRNLNDAYNLSYELVQHAAAVGDTSVRQCILQSIASVVRSMDLPLGSWQGVLSLLLIHYEAAATGPTATMEAYLEVFAAFCLKMPSPGDVLHLLGIVLDSFMAESLPESPAQIKLLQLARAVTMQRKEAERDADRSKLTPRLVAVLERCSSVSLEVYLEALRVCVLNCVPPGKTESILLDVTNTNAMNAIHFPTLSSSDRRLIRTHIHLQLTASNAYPSQHHFYLLIALLCGSIQSELLGTVPMILDLARFPRFQFVCAAYLWQLARMTVAFDPLWKDTTADMGRLCPLMEEYVSEFVSRLGRPACITALSPETGMLTDDSKLQEQEQAHETINANEVRNLLVQVIPVEKRSAFRFIEPDREWYRQQIQPFYASVTATFAMGDEYSSHSESALEPVSEVATVKDQEESVFSRYDGVLGLPRPPSPIFQCSYASLGFAETVELLREKQEQRRELFHGIMEEYELVTVQGNTTDKAEYTTFRTNTLDRVYPSLEALS